MSANAAIRMEAPPNGCQQERGLDAQSASASAMFSHGAIGNPVVTQGSSAELGA